jgi:hypothetical protein
MPKVYKSQLIELVVPANSGARRFQFQDQPYLRGKKITSIEILNSGDVNASPTGNAVITDTQMQKSYLTLYLDDVNNRQNVGEWIQLVPFSILHRIQNSSTNPFVRQMFDLQSQVVYWEKCYINVSSSLGNTTDISYLIQVYFKD